jgi:hypothetical protein
MKAEMWRVANEALAAETPEDQRASETDLELYIWAVKLAILNARRAAEAEGRYR